MEHLLTFLIKNILGESIDFEIIKSESSAGIIQFKIKISTDQKPRLIGKNGRTIRAIYTLVNVIARRERKHINIDIED